MEIRELWKAITTSGNDGKLKKCENHLNKQSSISIAWNYGGNTMGLIYIIIFMFLLAIINNFIALADLKKFLSQRGSIKNDQDLESYKGLVRKQMVQALLQIAFLGVMGIAGLMGIIYEKLSFNEFVLFLALNVIIFILGAYTKKIEDKVRSLTVEDENLAKGYSFFSQYWVNKPFPNF